MANNKARNLLFRNTGHGFEEMGMDAGVAYNGDGRSISGMGADFGDIDGDGRFDLIMTALKGETFDVFLNRGHGEFEDGSISSGLMSPSHPVSGWGCGLVDLDNDGWLDLFVAGGGIDTDHGMTNRIFKNSSGKFTDVSRESGVGLAPPRLHRGCVFADFDRDGRLNVAVTASTGRLNCGGTRVRSNTGCSYGLRALEAIDRRSELRYLSERPIGHKSAASIAALDMPPAVTSLFISGWETSGAEP